ncbi:glycosyltransferase [Deinococcus aerius]|uniref:glycosyltransferase n=1 Tax=Deinococcus aerius TaxID=200253 RepID=UPI000CCC6026|nr:glycosyltransferase [Deinococcus aerius]
MQRKLRVLFIFEGLYGRGAERVSLSLVSQLDREQFEPRIWILRSHDELPGEVPADVQPCVALGPGQRIRHRPWGAARDLLREAARADVIVATVELLPTYLAYVAGLLTGRPVVGWVRNSLDRVFRELHQPALHRWLGRLIYPRLPRLVFVSHGLKNTLSRMFPLREERLSVIHNPLDLGRVRALAAEPLPEWAAFMTRRPTVLGVGRLTTQKGFDLLIEAHAALRARGLEHDLLILGEGEQEQLQDLARRLGVEGSVHLPGYTANPYPFMRYAAVFALSSRYEGFANVITEAMACGAPVVAADCPSGPAEILEGGRHGLLVPVDDGAALAQALGQVLEDGGLRERLREAGLRRAQDFAPERVVPAWEAVLRGAARQPGRGGRRTGRGRVRI